MIEATFGAEIAWVERALRDLAAATQKPYADVVRQNGRLIAVNLAIQTQPFGAGDEARAQGERAIRRDLKRVYTPAGRMYDQLRALGAKGGERLAKAFYAAMQRGDFAKAEQIMRSVGIHLPSEKFDGGDEHRRRRGSRGAVGRGSPSFVVANPKKLVTYGRKIIRHVGMAKGGWAGAAAGLGGLPQWMTRHKGNGSAVDRTSDYNFPHIILRNEVPWIRHALNPGQMKEALRIQREKMETRIEIVTTKLAAKHLT